MTRATPTISSAPSIALLVAGVLMLIVGFIGPRLQGRFAIEFGPHGASIEIQTHMAPRGRTRVAGALAPWKPADAFIASGGEDTRPKPGHDLTSKTIEQDAERLQTLLTDGSQGEQLPR